MCGDLAVEFQKVGATREKVNPAKAFVCYRARWLLLRSLRGWSFLPFLAVPPAAF